MGYEKANRARRAAVKVLLAAGFSVATGAVMADATIDHGMIQNVHPGVPYDATGELTVGEDGLGRFNILSGGEATNTNALIGTNATGKGEVSVSGADAKWINNGYLIIGLGGEGVVTVDGGASILVNGWTDLAANGGSRGQLTLLGAAGARGVFSTSDIMKGGGDGLLYWDGGILQATGNQLEFLPNFGFGDIDIRAGGAFSIPKLIMSVSEHLASSLARVV
jgi:T5SS/PEP-CTERM-associated repeat protein